MWIKTRAQVREQDAWGSGEYGAPRGNGRHRGVDFVSPPGSVVLAVSRGTVSRIGYPYDPSDSKKGHLRYVEVMDASGFKVRYFYLEPVVRVGNSVIAGTELGVSAKLFDIWPGMINHVHFEVMRGPEYLDPNKYLEEVMPSE